MAKVVFAQFAKKLAITVQCTIVQFVWGSREVGGGGGEAGSSASVQTEGVGRPVTFTHMLKK